MPKLFSLSWPAVSFYTHYTCDWTPLSCYHHWYTRPAPPSPCPTASYWWKPPAWQECQSVLDCHFCSQTCCRTQCGPAIWYSSTPVTSSSHVSPDCPPGPGVAPSCWLTAPWHCCPWQELVTLQSVTEWSWHGPGGETMHLHLMG